MIYFGYGNVTNDLFIRWQMVIILLIMSFLLGALIGYLMVDR